MTPQMTFSLAPRGRWRRSCWRAGAGWRHAAQHKYFGCDYLYSAISVNPNGLVHPCCYVVAPGDAVGDAAARLRNAPVLRSVRAALATVAAGAPGAVRAHAPCAACPVVASCDGHVVTQTGFRQLYEYLLHGTAIRW